MWFTLAGISLRRLQNTFLQSNKTLAASFRLFCGWFTLSWSEWEREEERWSASLIEPEREMEGPLFNYLPLTVFVICVDLLNGAKKKGGVGGDEIRAS